MHVFVTSVFDDYDDKMQSMKSPMAKYKRHIDKLCLIARQAKMPPPPIS